MKVYYSNPYARDKNIGRALNEFCAMVPGDSWIVLQDGDIMYLTDFWGAQIEDIISKNGDYDLIGCMTNRLRNTHQLHEGRVSEDTDIMNHMKIAEHLHKEHYDAVEQTFKPIAGMFMLFPKKTWASIRFRENTPAFDTFFSKQLIANGGKVGIAKGLYIFHKYRLGKPDIKNDKHLR
jgi:hypothetical protein